MIEKSRFVRVLVWAFFASQAMGFLLAWSPLLPQVVGMSVHLAPKGMAFDEARHLLSAQRWGGAALGLVALVTLSAGLWHLDRLLRGLSAQLIFSLANIAHLRAFAAATAGATVLSMLEVPTRGLMFRHLLDVKDARIKFEVSSNDLFLVLVCVVFYLIIDLMHAARRIAQENEGFV